LRRIRLYSLLLRTLFIFFPWRMIRPNKGLRPPDLASKALDNYPTPLLEIQHYFPRVDVEIRNYEKRVSRSGQK
jgi:hypothetical protein